VVDTQKEESLRRQRETEQRAKQNGERTKEMRLALRDKVYRGVRGGLITLSNFIWGLYKGGQEPADILLKLLSTGYDYEGLREAMLEANIPQDEIPDKPKDTHTEMSYVLNPDKVTRGKTLTFPLSDYSMQRTPEKEPQRLDEAPHAPRKFNQEVLSPEAARDRVHQARRFNEEQRSRKGKDSDTPSESDIDWRQRLQANEQGAFNPFSRQRPIHSTADDSTDIFTEPEGREHGRSVDDPWVRQGWKAGDSPLVTAGSWLEPRQRESDRGASPDASPSDPSGPSALTGYAGVETADDEGDYSDD
jgi:hypothetical protein